MACRGQEPVCKCRYGWVRYLCWGNPRASGADCGHALGLCPEKLKASAQRRVKNLGSENQMNGRVGHSGQKKKKKDKVYMLSEDPDIESLKIILPVNPKSVEYPPG